MRWRDELGLPNDTLHIFFEEYAKIPEPGTEPPMWHQVEMGLATIQQFLDHVRPKLDGLVPDDHPVHSMDEDDFNVFSNAGAHWQMVHKVRQLSDAGHKTAILTNNVHEWRAWREVVPVDWFDVVIDSCEVGLRKPDPAIWQLTLERLECTPERSIFLDDHPANVEAAVALGMQGVVVGPEIDAAVADLDRVVEEMMRGA